MTAESTDALWLGYFHGNFSDAQLTGDILRFLQAQAPPMPVPEVRIVRGKFTQARIMLTKPLTREQVHALNGKPFVECRTERSVTVDDAHGSPDQRCPRSIARYCRGQTLRFTDPCWCRHDPLPTASASFTLKPLEIHSAKGDEIQSAFLQSAPFHDGMPKVVAIHAVDNPSLEKQHEFYRQYLTQKNGEAPRQIELYHGTNMNILDTVYTHGLFPPSDMEASESCPVSGGRGLRTSLCTNACKFCTKRHEWDRCHMYGLGVYLADIAQKSHRYVSATEVADGQAGLRKCKIVLCSVLLGDARQLEGHLRSGDSMHDVHSLRGLAPGDLPRLCDITSKSTLCGKPADQRDILFVKGMECNCRPGFSVFNSEFISFHPSQCLPRDEITYLAGDRASARTSRGERSCALRGASC
jgi:hypothetical protein